LGNEGSSLILLFVLNISFVNGLDKVGWRENISGTVKNIQFVQCVGGYQTCQCQGCGTYLQQMGGMVTER